MVPATDKGATAEVTIGGVKREVPVTRSNDAPPRIENAFVVMRPDSIEVSKGAGVFAWRGKVVNRRFAGGVEVYRIELADGITVDVESQIADAHEGDNVSVSPLKRAFPLVAG